MGDGGIGLHIREDDSADAIEIIKQMDLNNKTNSEDISYHDADQEDIAYEKAIAENAGKVHWLYLLIVCILILVIFRAVLQAVGYNF